MSTSKINIQFLEAEFFSMQPIFIQYSQEVTKQISKLLEDSDAKLAVPIQFRAKTWESILNKVSEKRFEIKSSILEMQDLVGFRIILIFKQDIEIVAKIIRESFKQIKEYDTGEKLAEDQFGYSSKHLVVEINEDWLKLPTLRNFKDLKCEIQIRTLSQHAWAEASNIFQYKSENNVPAPLKRRISRIAALLETVDYEFEQISNERLHYKEQLVKDLDKNQELNVDLLQKILQAKFGITRKLSEDYSSLLEDLKHFGINSEKKLDTFFIEYIEQALESEKSVIAYMQVEEVANSAIHNNYDNGLFFTITGIIRQMLFEAFAEEFTEYQIEKRG